MRGGVDARNRMGGGGKGKGGGGKGKGKGKGKGRSGGAGGGGWAGAPRACSYWAEGSCTKGDSCPFSHGEGATGVAIRLAANTGSAGGEAPSPGRTPRPRRACTFFAAGVGPCAYEHDERSQQPCSFFAKGACRDGERCPFSHGAASGAAAAPEPEPPPPQDDEPSQQPCSFFAQGFCRDKDRCRFSHGESKPVGAPGPPPPPQQQEQHDERGQQPCSFFAKGFCRDMERCHFSHGAAPFAASEPPPPPLALQKHTSTGPPGGVEPTKRRGQCSFFAAGGCKRGAECTFEHDERSLQPCSFFTKGRCMNDRCPYSHVLGGGAGAAAGWAGGAAGWAGEGAGWSAGAAAGFWGCEGGGGGSGGGGGGGDIAAAVIPYDPTEFEPECPFPAGIFSCAPPTHLVGFCLLVPFMSC